MALFLAAGLLPNLGETSRAWSLAVGFIVLVPTFALSHRRGLAPVAVVLVFVVYGGISALVAVPESAEQQAQHAKALTKEQVKASQRAAEFEGSKAEEEDAFQTAALLTAIAGLLASGAALVAGAGSAPGPVGSPRRSQDQAAEPSAGSMEMAGRVLVFIAFLGVAAALVRFAATQLPTDNLHRAIKSFWEGGSYFLLIATFAIPGFGLWLQGLLHRSPSRPELLRLFGWSLLYLTLLVPTGQRGFAIALALMVVGIITFDGYLKARHLVAVVMVGVALLGLSQAARNQIREEGEVTPSGLVSRVAPREWKSLYGSQLASFNWIVQVVEFKDRLDIPNPFPQLLLKPVPRQIYPDKSQGFGQEFTQRVYPEAASQEISFAIPLVAESYYAFGIAGLVVLFLALGSLVGLAESRFASHTQPMVRPLVLATIGWCLFVLIRGDLANAVVFASGWVIPLLLMSRSIGLRSEARPRRIVIDALQVAPDYSGIGRRVVEIGRSLREEGTPLPLTVRCAANVVAELKDEFPVGTDFHTPLRSARPRVLRIAYQQCIAPLFDRGTTLLVCPGDQAPVWGRAPLVFVVHDVRRLTRPETSRSRVEAAFYRTVMRLAALRAQGIVTISEFSRGEIERALAPSCPIVVAGFHRPPAVREACVAASPTFVTVGALRRYKGLETVIEALARLREEGERDVRVVCVGGDEGDREYRAQLSAYARRLGVDDRFELAGWIADDELDARCRSCMGTVNPSTYEGYGLPVEESLSRGMPTIASEIPPHKEIAADAALYFKPEDAPGLAEHLRRLAHEAELRERLARAALERCEQLAEGSDTWSRAICKFVPESAFESATAGRSLVPR